MPKWRPLRTCLRAPPRRAGKWLKNSGSGRHVSSQPQHLPQHRTRSPASFSERRVRSVTRHEEVTDQARPRQLPYLMAVLGQVRGGSPSDLHVLARDCNLRQPIPSRLLARRGPGTVEFVATVHHRVPPTLDRPHLRLRWGGSIPKRPRICPQALAGGTWPRRRVYGRAPS